MLLKMILLSCLCFSAFAERKNDEALMIKLETDVIECMRYAGAEGVPDNLSFMAGFTTIWSLSQIYQTVDSMTLLKLRTDEAFRKELVLSTFRGALIYHSDCY